MVTLSRWICIIVGSSLLIACASARMAQNVQSGRVTFDSGNFKQAFAELLPLAVKSSPAAQYAVGYMYYYGLGVEAHKESGLFWINQSAQQMYRPAVKALQIIARDKTETYDTPIKKSNKVNYVENDLSETLKDPEIQNKIAIVKKENAAEQDPLRLAVTLTPENKEEDEVLLSLKDLPVQVAEVENSKLIVGGGYCMRDVLLAYGTYPAVSYAKVDISITDLPLLA